MYPAAKLLLLHALAASTIPGIYADSNDGVVSCIPQERDALLAFKQGISSDPMDLLASWRKANDGKGDCCRWRGVRCSNRTGHVLKLQLRNGQASLDTALVGQISRSLLSLGHLDYLDLSMNDFSGSSGHIPEYLSSLVNLRYLNLSGIPFSGRVPPHLGNLSKLQYLDLSDSTYMYSTDISWLAGLQALEHLSMRMVNLTTIVDWPDVMNMIPSLKVLSLRECSLMSANQSVQRINLTSLERLDLSFNHFHQPMASSWFWNLTGLQYLNLAGNGLYSQVSDSLGDMTSLQVLDLAFNQNISIMTTSLEKLCNLTVLDLSDSQVNGNLKELIDGMVQCPTSKLQELDLRDNNITGIIPSQIAHLTSLVVLDISSNILTGHVPSEIGMLANLTELNLSFNKLNGNITEKHFMRLAKLNILDLSANSLKIRVSSEWLPPFSLQEAALRNCEIGPLFPAWLRSQVNILWVDISSTGLVGKLPDWFSTTFSKTTFLDISHNQINGTLPKNMESMSLECFYLSSNQLTGQIPTLPKNLSMLDLSLNSLSGNIPSKLGTSQLVSLNLFSNHIIGDLSGSICEQQLFALDLGNNHFEGELPLCFQARTISFLLLSNNSFSGNFPLFLQNSNHLLFLDLSRNKFSGKLPYWIGGLVGLRFLCLSQNMFSGNIPTTITNLTHLHHLNLANNRLLGIIPWGLSNLTAMTGKYVKDAYVDENPYGGYANTLAFGRANDFSAVTKGQELSYGVTIFQMVSIDLSFNNLSGGIPKEIASLDALVNLDLSWNHITGEVPDKIGVMKSLESLDLSNNMLSGEIPSSLSNLSYLSYLDLSDNSLTGRIPSGQQLDTLYAEHPSMYSGNSGLCGPPLQKICSGNNASRQDIRNRNGLEPMSFYFGLGLGFMLGLWVVFCILLFKKARRIAYFRHIDSIYDQIYVFVIVTWKSLAREGSTD